METKSVDDRSSCLDDPIIETKRHISINHMDVCRFFGPRDPEYSKVASAMTYILKKTESGTHTRSHPPHKGPLSHGSSVAGEQLWDASPPEAQGCAEETALRVTEETALSVCNRVDASVEQSPVKRLHSTEINEGLTGLKATQGTNPRLFFSTGEYIAWRGVSQLPRLPDLPWFQPQHKLSQQSTSRKRPSFVARPSPQGMDLEKRSIVDRQGILVGLLGRAPSEGLEAMIVPKLVSDLSKSLLELVEGEAPHAVHKFLDPTTNDPSA
ncbi:hypothetical protein B0H63DRAFT_221280 [Podospora didyma]|uniref:Uncharacterized protein n=1 Tax=Podospora didyma TaxID=330526 RepID=A0AAE0KJX7_9PEZI|nr:hypothetical protein B0H63DRAFT_221280 [Podospora didyma]